MGGKGRPKAELMLSEEERARLARGARAARSTQAYALRCRIVLACADGASNAEVAARFGVSPPTVGKWRSRFVARGLPGLADAPRAGRPPTIGPGRVEQVVAATLSSQPERAARWSRASMAAHSGLSASTVGRIWRRFDLRPHVQDGHRLAADPRFVARVVGVVGLYRHPPGRAVVLCTDDAPPTRGPGWTRSTTVPAPRAPAGGAATGRGGNRSAEYRRFLLAVDRAVPAALDVHVICDDAAVQGSAAVRAWLARHPRFHVHLTPAGRSWVEQAERWFALLGEELPAWAGAGGGAGTDSRTWVAPPRTWWRAPEEVRRPLAGHRGRTPGHRERTSGAEPPPDGPQGLRATPPTMVW
ncbi:IS630 family transposase [Micromonospora oryzae]|uniref:IS630 family transposase n=1 Tax=Micromonospora sp. DSM 102119 TaxID=3111768 RepID=UPI0031DE6978